MKFGELLRKIRTEYGLSINKLGHYANVTPTYISRLENQHDKLPSEDMINKIIIGLGKYKMEKGEKIDPVALLEYFYKASNMPKSDKSLDELALILLNAYTLELNTALGYVSKLENIIYENRLMLPKGKTKGEVLDDPVFDLTWLLTQNRFELFYGRDYLLNDDHQADDERRFYYNTINDEDKNIINALIKAYISAKYSKIKEPREYFADKFAYYYKELNKSVSKLSNTLKEKPFNKED